MSKLNNEKRGCHSCGGGDFHALACRFNKSEGLRTLVLDSECSSERHGAAHKWQPTSDYGSAKCQICPQHRDHAIHQVSDAGRIGGEGHDVSCDVWVYPDRPCSCASAESDEEYETRPRIINPPDRIFLQTGCDDEVGEIEWAELSHADVTWCEDRIGKTDIEYLRKQSIIDRLKKKRDEWQATIDSGFLRTSGEVYRETGLRNRIDAANELIAEFEKE